MLQREQERIPRLQNYGTFPLPFGSSWKSFKPSTPLRKSMTVSQNDKCGKLWIMDWNGIGHVSFFFVLKIFLQSFFMCPIYLLNFCKFPSSNPLDVQLDISTQWIVYSNLRRIWLHWMNLWVLLVLMNLRHFLRYLKCFKFL